MATHFFYDLSISDTQLEPETQKERTSLALSLGYHGVATPHQAGTKLSNADRCSIRRLEVEELLAATSSKSAPQTENNAAYKAIQLTRLNIPVEDTNVAQETVSNASVVGSYDLLAAQPLSERAFAFSCTSLDVDIISLDLSKRLSFRIRSDLVNTAVKRGLHFEILYAPILREPGSRRQIFANAQALARETRGRAIILSSGARTVLDLRGPYDVVNLATFLGLNEAQAHAAVGKNAAACVERARTRKAFRKTLLIRAFKPQKDTELTLETMETDV